MPDRVLDDSTYHAIATYATSALDGFSTGSEPVSDIVEFEVSDGGLFIGLDPANDDSEVLLQLYLYVADPQSFTTKTGSINDHPTIAALRKELYRLLETTFADTTLEWDEVTPTMSVTDPEEEPGRYYVLDVPRTAVKQQ